MSFIFLSHSSDDDRSASAVRDWLAAEGHQSIFLDHDEREGISGGEVWKERLYTELRRCRALLALVSPSWLASPWCVAEANHAQALRKPVVPIRIADVDRGVYARTAPPVLLSVQAIDWSTGKEAKRRLRDALIRSGLDPTNLFVWDGERDPYPGLPAFDRADAPVYFGRDQEITDLLADLDIARAPGRSRLIIVHGASGTGKSSLVRAGVLPRLERDPTRWLVVPPFRPLQRPFHELADVLMGILGAPAFDAAPDVTNGEDAWSSWIVKAASELRQRSRQPGATVLITVDQLEEALHTGDRLGERFLLSLRDALQASDFRLLCLVTLRANFVGVLQSHAMLCRPSRADGEILPTRPFPLGPMPRSSFHTVIEGPANVAGLDLEAGLTPQLVEDTRSEDALPLLAFVLRELWTRRGKASLHLTRSDYARFGGLENAVGERADRIFSELGASEAEIADFRSTLIAMADLSPEGIILRRPIPRTEVPREAHRIVDAFATERLLVIKKTGVEVAHEALFRQWKTLAGWVEAAREDLLSRGRIERSFQAWRTETADKESRLLPPGRPLNEALDLNARAKLPTEVRAFIIASQHAARRKWRRQVATLTGLAMLVGLAVLGWREKEYLMLRWSVWQNVLPDATERIYAQVPRQEFRECSRCPLMVVVPAGEFMMGSPERKWIAIRTKAPSTTSQ